MPALENYFEKFKEITLDIGFYQVKLEHLLLIYSACKIESVACDVHVIAYRGHRALESKTCSLHDRALTFSIHTISHKYDIIFVKFLTY